MSQQSDGYGLYLDIQTTQHLLYNRRGIPRYVAAQAKALLNHPGLVRGVYFNPLRPFPDHLDETLLRLPTLSWSSMQSFRLAADQGPLAYYIMSPFEMRRTSEAFLPPFAMRPEIPIVITMYDLIPLLRAKKYLGDRNLAMEYYGRLEFVKQADLILTISEHTRQDALDWLRLDPAKVVNIGAGVSGYFRPAGPGDRPAERLAAELPGIRKPFILSVSGAEERKNTEGLIRAFSLLPRALRDNLQLVVTCKLNDHFLPLWLREIEQSGLTTEDVILTDLVSDPVLLALYQEAELFIFASFYEGFGLVAAEAAACGCPTILSNTSSLPEIFNFPPATFDPANPQDMADHMQKALTDTAFNAELREVAARTAPIHTWEAVADRTVAALKLLPPPATPNRRRPAPKRKRIALVGPFPPLSSGIADYNARLAAELSEVCELDIYIAGGGDPRSSAPGLSGVRRFSVDALGRILNPFAYDAVVYAFGNNDHHHTTYEKALEYPGIAWLHDVQLSGLFLSYAAARSGPQARDHLSGMLARLYPHRMPDELAANPAPSIDDFASAGMFLTGDIVEKARGVIVHSELARRLVELDQGGFCSLPPFRVLPHPVGVTGVPVRRRPGDDPLVATFGILAQNKLPERLVDAVAHLRRTLPVRLAFVGKVDKDFDVESLMEYARRAGVGPAVTVTGALTDREYHRWLGRAACAVQLRRRTDGESSGAVADCLGASVPVITNLPSCRELPEGTVRMTTFDASTEQLADQIGGLLSDPETAGAQARLGAEWAEAHTFRRAALDLLKFVDALESPGAGVVRPLPGALTRSAR